MHIRMNELTNEGAGVLAGAIPGRKAFTKLLEQAAEYEPSSPEPLFLDFAEINVATASFLRECIFALRNTIRSRRSNLYPVIANANKLVIDELAVLLAPRGDVLLLCLLDGKGEPCEPRLLGVLDPKQRITFDLVQELEETTAAELHKQCTVDSVEQTAWNNRLAALAGLGVIVELSHGRAKRYRPLLKGVEHGS